MDLLHIPVLWMDFRTIDAQLILEFQENFGKLYFVEFKVVCPVYCKGTYSGLNLDADCELR